MRSACGLPVRQRQQYVEEGLANLLDADAESDQERQEKSDVWDNLRRFFVQQMIEKELDFMTFYDFKKLALISADHPNLSKSDMWDALEKMMSCELQSGSRRPARRSREPTFRS